MKRECGVLLPVFSIPSKYGIGAFSREAYEFVDQLKKAGQQYWQILPLGPTGYGDSPYQSFSAFAGNPYFIDLEQLVEEELLTREECEQADFGDNPEEVNYDKLYQNRFPLLRKAFERWKKLQAPHSGIRLQQLLEENLMENTIEYCFYMAVKNSFGGKNWTEWDDDIRKRQPSAVRIYWERLADEIMFYEFQQVQFEKQWFKLKKYANDSGIRIIGDIPIYVAFDGADSWSHPELFQFDKDCRPTGVAGCPPDAFSATGQLWGNPLYRWDYHKKTGYDWWLKRMEYSYRLYDVVRVDHFRGFDEYYSIPYGDETAEFGHWEKGPGLELFDAMKKKFGDPDIIAEDLGFLTPSVYKLLEDSGFPGMKVLEFAFDGSENSDYLVHKYPENCIVYTGTHDNQTLQGWFGSLDDYSRRFAVNYMGSEWTPREEIHWDVIRLALRSIARLALVPMQDYLGLDDRARINAPSTFGGNWRWRMTAGAFNDELAEKCRRMAKWYGRTGEERIRKHEEEKAVESESAAVSEEKAVESEPQQ